MSTPHNQASKGDFASTVLMPGDPLRSRFIAEHYLENVRLVNNVRGVQGYTGTYHGVPVSVMASGMGMPSIGIYSYELFTFYDVDRIIRVGSAGSLHPDVHLRDLVLAQAACTNSSFMAQYGARGSFAPIADFGTLRTATEIAEERCAPYHVGNLLSSDTFYDADETANESWIKLNVLAVEMEAAALYATAAYCKKKALAICTISDCILTQEQTTPEERQTSFTEMIEVALETAIL